MAEDNNRYDRTLPYSGLASRVLGSVTRHFFIEASEPNIANPLQTAT